MNSQFSLPSMLEHCGNAYATFENDPIFTPLFVSLGFSTAGILGTSISAVSIASAVSAGGGYLEFDHVRS
ncbi:hypothetical protein G8E10_04880 [Rhizobiaceae bacterium CRRU44]|uniref:Uncharacterized protein n=1 Tax=Ferranicluibacter rubi TaxID=2715133 RepID=A0AA43ZEM8_9HYPH|nr:hypothetical protein [Ferranicluibacter rubi]NHT75091.1 hypothetical protein [Ferranicluibacter rubi]